MKRITYYLFALLSVAFMTACSGGDEEFEQETPDTPQKPKITELTFTTTVQTRALPEVLTDLKDGSQMSIFVTYSNNTSATIMNKAICSSGTWKASPSIELVDGVNIKFRAAYPYNASATSTSAVPVKVSEQKDYLYSSSEASVSKNFPTASITMHHAMSVLAFNIDKGSYKGDGKLQEIKLSGDGFFTEGNMNITTGSITGSAKGEYAKAINQDLIAGGFTSNIPALFTIPANSTGSNYLLTIKVDNKEYSCNLPKQTISGGNKYLFRLVLSENELYAFEELTEIVSLNADADDMPERKISTLKVKHSNKNMDVPIITGSENLFGKIYWGDDQSEDYKSKASHKYTNEGTYTITIESWGAKELELENLSGISEIDLSNF